MQPPISRFVSMREWNYSLRSTGLIVNPGENHGSFRINYSFIHHYVGHECWPAASEVCFRIGAPAYQTDVRPDQGVARPYLSGAASVNCCRCDDSGYSSGTGFSGSADNCNWWHHSQCGQCLILQPLDSKPARIKGGGLKFSDTLLALIVFLVFSFALMPEVSRAQPSTVEVDAREVSWHVVRRLALAAGQFPPLYQPVSEKELASIWPGRYSENTSGLSWSTCECKDNPATFRLQGRVLLGYQELGDVLVGESGLGWAAGYNASFEPRFDVSSGRWWAAVSARLQGRLASGGQQLQPSDEWAWPGWRQPTGNYQVGRARTRGDDWILNMPRLVAGCRLDGWNLTAGWMPAQTGLGMTGALVLDRNGPNFPSLVLRRNRAFSWNGFMKPVAPDNFLLRVGKLSNRNVVYVDEWGIQRKNEGPWFFQWLVGWNVTSWFRTSFTHTVMATAREGTLWPDLLQINFPLIGTTWREADSGPITDRLFSMQFEFRWNKAPWPLLPSESGRLYWDYSGTDFLPSGPGGVIPQLSIPASVAGVELVSSSWDLTLEYFGTYHPEALWYSNGGYVEGYTQNEWLLGHSMGGGARGGVFQVRVRPGGQVFEYGLKLGYTNWQHQWAIPGEAERRTVAVSVGRNAETTIESLQWTAVVEWAKEDKYLHSAAAMDHHWLRASIRLGY